MLAKNSKTLSRKRKKINPFFLFLFCVGIVQTLTAQTPKQLEGLSFKELDSIMILHHAQGNFKAAIPYAKQGSQKAKLEFGATDSVYAEYLSDLGYFYYQTGQYQEVEAVFAEVVAIKTQVMGKNHPSYVKSVNNLAAIYQQLGEYEQAFELLNESVQIEATNPDFVDYDYSFTLNNLAALYRELGQFEKAEPLLRKALKAIKGNKKYAFEYTVTLNNLALVYQNMGYYEEAEQLFLHLLYLRERLVGRVHPEYASTLNNLAALYYTQNNYEQAEKLYLQAVDIDKKTLSAQHPSFGVNLNNLAELYRKTGKYKSAEQLYLNTQKIWEETLGKNHRKYALNLNNLALVHFNLNEWDQAEQLYLEAQALWIKNVGKEHPAYANTLNNLANLYTQQQQYSKADKHYQQTIDLRKQLLGTQHPDYIKSLNDWGNMLVQQQKLDAALAIIYQALHYNCSNDSLNISNTPLTQLSNYRFYSNRELIRSLDLIYQVSYQQYQQSGLLEALKKGYTAVQVAMNFTEQLRHSFNDEKSKLRVLNQSSNLAHLLISTGLLIYKQSNDQRYLAQAFGHSEQNKSILLADAAKGQRARTLSDLPDSIALQEIALFQKKKLLEKKEIETSHKQAHIIRSQINALELDIATFLKQLKNQYPKYYKLRYEKTEIQLETIQSKLAANTMLLEFFVTDTLVYLFCLTTDNLQVFPLAIDKPFLYRQVNRLRKTLSDYKFIKNQPQEAYELYARTAYWFYKQLLEPVLQDTTIQNLLIITDGELGYLPFETFLTAAAPPKLSNYATLPYLLKQYNISYNYSATVWQENTNTIQQNNHQILACAASYGAIDSVFMSRHRSKTLRKIRNSLVPLPETPTEIQAISDLYDGTFLEGNASGEAYFKNHAPNYGIIHLAMHGILHPNIPMLSSLAFTENQDTTEDNFLQAYEIAHLNLNADLVVLSACETGYGKFEQGEGIISLARSFMYAGTPSLVVSLWQVNDYSTARIMDHFYQQLAKGQNKDAALRQAKLNYIASIDSSSIYTHPAFWSPFIQLGDNTPISIAAKTNYYPYLVLVIIMIVFIVLIGRIRKKNVA